MAGSPGLLSRAGVFHTSLWEKKGLHGKEPNVPTAGFKVCVNTLKENRVPLLRLQRESDFDREFGLFEM